MKNDKFIERLNHARTYNERQCEECYMIFNEMQDVYESKDSDYCEGEIPMQNLRACEELGIPAWKGTLIRMGDKKRRIQSFFNKGMYRVEDEKLEDTLVDMANYALLCSILIEEDTSLFPALITGVVDMFARIAAMCVGMVCSNRRSGESTPDDFQIYWPQILNFWEIITNVARGICR